MGVALVKQLNQRVTLTGDEEVAVNVWYTGAARGEITWDATKFSFEEDDSLDASVNTGGTTAGEITDAEAATLGAVVDAINGDTDGNWHANIAAGFRDSDTSDLLAITETTVTRDGIQGATGAVKKGVGWDQSDLSTDLFVACIGAEADNNTGGAGRASESNIRRQRDVGETATFGDDLNPLDTMGRVYQFLATVGSATGVMGITIYSAKQSDDLSDAAVLYNVALAEDTEKDVKFTPPADLQAAFGERIVVVIDSDVAFDAVDVRVIGAYGEPGPLAQVA